MRILYYLSRFPGYGGIETVTNFIGTYLVNTGKYQVDVLSHRQEEREMALSHSSKLFSMPDADNWTSPLNISFAEAVVRDGHYDVIIYQDSYAPTERIVCTLAKKFHVRLFVCEHSAVLWFENYGIVKSWKHPIQSLISIIKGKKRWLMSKKRHKYLLEYCEKYFLLSNNHIDEMNRLLGDCYDKGKVHVMNNPIAYAPFSQDLLPKKKNIVLTVCQLTKNKNVALMLRMWKLLEPRLPNWRFVVVGDGPEMDNLKSIVSLYNLHSVELVGFAEPNPYYEEAKLFWMTSKFEGFGMTLLEAMQKGCVPVVMHSFPSVTDIISDNKNGFLIKQNDIESFVETTYTLAKAPEQLGALALSAVESAGRFDVHVIGNVWEKELEN